MLVRRCVRLDKWLCRRGMIPIRDIERGEEIQEGKARCPGAKEEGDEEGEAGKKGKVEETCSETCPGSDNSITASAPARVCSGAANRRGHDWSLDGHALLHCTCPLLTQSGHERTQRTQITRNKKRAPLRGPMCIGGGFIAAEVWKGRKRRPAHEPIQKNL